MVLIVVVVIVVVVVVAAAVVVVVAAAAAAVVKNHSIYIHFMRCTQIFTLSLTELSPSLLY